jgi:hypothetical protein
MNLTTAKKYLTITAIEILLIMARRKNG